MDDPPYTTRLYSSLSEPRPIMGMDWRLCWAAALAMVAGVILIPFSCALCYAPTFGCLLLSVWLSRLGKRLWSDNPYFIDEYWAHVRTPFIGGADEKVQ